MKSGNQIWGLVGSLFVSACCLGAAPIIVATATALGVGALKSVLSVYVLGPLMIASVGWVVWNMKIQAEALGVLPMAYVPFWLALGGGIVACIGVLLPNFSTGTGSIGMALIVIGMLTLLAGSTRSLIDQRRGVR
jgi:hypothetical protein